MIHLALVVRVAAVMAAAMVVVVVVAVKWPMMKKLW